MTKTFRSALVLSAMSLACGGESPAPSTTPPPGAPAGFMCMVMGTGAHCTWQDTFTDETGFELARKDGSGEFQVIFSLPAGTVDKHDGTAPTSTDLVYRARALNAGGQGAWSSEAAVRIESAPPEPDQALGTPANAMAHGMTNHVYVMWSYSGSGATGLEIGRKVDDGDFAVLKTLAPAAQDYTDRGVSAGHKYTYRVRAVAAETFGEWSAEVSATL